MRRFLHDVLKPARTEAGVPHDSLTRRLYLTAIALLLVGAGLAAFASIFWAGLEIRGLMRQEMAIDSAEARRLFAAVLTDRVEKAELTATARLPQRALRQLMQEPADGEARRQLSEAAAIASQNGFSGVAYELNGTRIASAGSFTEDSAFGLPLAVGENAILVWKGEFILKVRAAIRDGAGTIGELVTEQKLTVLTEALNRELARQDSRNMPICGLTDQHQACFPLREHAEPDFYPLTVDGVPLPMTRACRGETATVITRDYRRVEVMAAFGPIGGTGLCLSKKIDVAELYAPIWHALWTGMPFGVAIIASITWVMHRALAPIVLELTRSRGELETLAMHDTLTGLPNRRIFIDRLERAMGRARRNRRLMALVYVDIDHFKAINDRLGHARGDEFLLWVTELLRARTRETDTVCRLGGDEFTLIYEDLTAFGDAIERIADLCEDKIFTLPNGVAVKAGFSIGIAFYDGTIELSADDLKHRADQALYQAKERGRNTYVVHEDAKDVARIIPLRLKGHAHFFETSGARYLFDAWNAARTGLDPPLRNRIDLRRFEGLRDQIGFLERSDRDSIFVREPGRSIQLIIGLDVSGRNILDLTSPTARDVRAARYAEVFERPCGLEFVHSAIGENGEPLEVEGLVLPLGGHPSMAISGYFVIGGTASGRLGQHRMEVRNLAHRLSFIDIGFGVPAIASEPPKAERTNAGPGAV